MERCFYCWRFKNNKKKIRSNHFFSFCFQGGKKWMLISRVFSLFHSSVLIPALILGLLMLFFSTSFHIFKNYRFNYFGGQDYRSKAVSCNIGNICTDSKKWKGKWGGKSKVVNLHTCTMRAVWKMPFSIFSHASISVSTCRHFQFLDVCCFHCKGSFSQNKETKVAEIIGPVCFIVKQPQFWPDCQKSIFYSFYLDGVSSCSPSPSSPSSIYVLK